MDKKNMVVPTAKILSPPNPPGPFLKSSSWLAGPRGEKMFKLTLNNAIFMHVTCAIDRFSWNGQYAGERKNRKIFLLCVGDINYYWGEREKSLLNGSIHT